MLVGAAVLGAEPREPQHFRLSIERPGDSELLPGGAALCAALGMKPGEPCDSYVILEKSQHSTDQELWIEKTVGQRKDEPLTDCLRPIAISEDGHGGITYVCHVRAQDDTVTVQDVDRLERVATTLNARPVKTLAEHQWIMNFKTLWDRVNR